MVIRRRGTEQELRRMVPATTRLALTRAILSPSATPVMLLDAADPPAYHTQAADGSDREPSPDQDAGEGDDQGATQDRAPRKSFE